MLPGSLSILPWAALFVSAPVVALCGPAYAPWAADLPAGKRGLGHDPDRNGRPNGVEFVTGPDDSNPLPGAEANGPDRFATLTFRLAAPSFADVTLVVQASGDLLTWTELATLSPEPSPAWTGPGRVEHLPWPDGEEATGVRYMVRDIVPVTSAAPRFLRLAVLPVAQDSDGDGLSDDWEIAHGLDPETADAHLDHDGDGLSNEDELLPGTRPDRRDSDGDGRMDGFEIAAGTDPTVPDGTAWAGHGRHPGTGLLVYLPGK